MPELNLVNGFAVSSLLAMLASVVAIAVASYILVRLLHEASRRVAERLVRGDEEVPRERQQKAKTLAGIVETTGRMLIIVIAGLMALQQIGLPIAPLLASAGVVGIAAGLAAQGLIRDYIAGFLIVWENQFAVGDVITVGEHSGMVEHMSFRTTVLRNLEGAVITVPNGEIRVVSNLTRGWSRVALDVNIAYKEDVDRAIGVLRQAAIELASDPGFGPQILEEPAILGVDDLGEYQVTIKLLIKTQPLKQWDVAREMRARIKKAFEREGIEHPVPRRVFLTPDQMLGDESKAAAGIGSEMASPS